MIMMRVNSAIQISIVNQQYARAQATWLAFNYGIFPETKLRLRDFYSKQYNEMILGVSKNSPGANTDGGGAVAYTPQPMIQDIRRSLAAKQGSNDASLEGEGDNPQRSAVRIRTTVALCTQPIFTTSGPVLNYTNPTAAAPTRGAYGLLDQADQFSNGDLCNSPYLQSTSGGTGS